MARFQGSRLKIIIAAPPFTDRRKEGGVRPQPFCYAPCANPEKIAGKKWSNQFPKRRRGNAIIGLVWRQRRMQEVADRNQIGGPRLPLSFPACSRKLRNEGPAFRWREKEKRGATKIICEAKEWYQNRESFIKTISGMGNEVPCLIWQTPTPLKETWRFTRENAYVIIYDST